jgi:transposase
MLAKEAGMHMAKALSVDLRRGVVDAIAQGLSCRKAAERFGVSASSAIRWRDRLKKEGDIAPKNLGGDRKSGRIEAEASFILGAVAETPPAIAMLLTALSLCARGHSGG